MDMDTTEEEMNKKLESFDQQILHEAKGNIPLQVCSKEIALFSLSLSLSFSFCLFLSLSLFLSLFLSVSLNNSSIFLVEINVP